MTTDARAFAAKTTDENLTSENWELILNLCDKVSDEGEQGYARKYVFLEVTAADRNATARAMSSPHSLSDWPIETPMFSSIPSRLQKRLRKTVG
jgi:hypothetical protein